MSDTKLKFYWNIKNRDKRHWNQKFYTDRKPKQVLFETKANSVRFYFFVASILYLENKNTDIT